MSNKANISDGYHTFDELYEHRAALLIRLANAYTNRSWKSRLHSDGSMFEGFFIVGMDLDCGQISYHLEDRYWDYLEDVYTLDNAPRWDGHTPNDVVKRLLESKL